MPREGAIIFRDLVGKLEVLGNAEPVRIGAIETSQTLMVPVSTSHRR
jgi:hypothetical protein